MGYAIAAELARQGASVALTARTEEPLREAARTIRAETGRRVLPITAHSREEKDRQAAVEAVTDTFGRLDCWSARPESTPPSTPRRSISTSTACAGCSRRTCWRRSTSPNSPGRPWMKDNGGSVLMMNTVAADAVFRMPAYKRDQRPGCSASRRTSPTNSPRGYGVNAVAPAFVRTPLHGLDHHAPAGDHRGQLPARPYRGGRGHRPRGGLPASPRASWITGVTLRVDGGKTIAAVTHDRPHPAPGRPVH
ncbi:SDR family NAD(P)-dependent oxidoreductase [Streptomyces sp. L7]